MKTFRKMMGPITLGCLLLSSGCAEVEANKKAEKALVTELKERVALCDGEQFSHANNQGEDQKTEGGKEPGKDREKAQDKDQIIDAPSITVNVKVCAYYTGDGFRPANPRDPSRDDLQALVSGEVYLTALITDTGAETQKLAIQTEAVGKLKRAIYEVFDYDIYHGSPTSALAINIQVYDDDGWPSGKEDKVRNLQEGMGKVLELYPPASIGIPFLQPIFDFVKATVDFIDPDDLLIGGVRYISRQDIAAGEGKTKTRWTLHDRIIKNDNGTIIITIQPRVQESAMDSVIAQTLPAN